MLGNFDVGCDILDEIALEGLDGITFNSMFSCFFWEIKINWYFSALLVRLRLRQGFGLGIDDYVKKYIWRLVRQIAEVQFFVISEKRQDIGIPSDLDDENQLTSLVSAVLLPIGFSLLLNEFHPLDYKKYFIYGKLKAQYRLFEASTSCRQP